MTVPEVTPQDQLWIWAQRIWPGQVVANYRLPIPGRKFEADIAFPSSKLAVEVDGWSFHGKWYSDFERDREKGNRLACVGWTLLRFPAMTVKYRLQRVIDTIQVVLVRTARARFPDS